MDEHKYGSVNTRIITMRARTLIGAGLAVALAGAMWSYQSPASARPHDGWGVMGGYAPGYGPGYDPGSDIQSNRTNNSPVQRFIVNRHNGFYRPEGN